MKSNKSEKVHNKKENRGKKEKKEKKPIIFGDEEVQNIPFSQIFKYSNGKEKLMTLFGIISSIIQGCAFPLIIYNLGDMTDSFISLVVNLKLKKITGIDNDNVLQDIMSVVSSGNLTNVVNLEQKYPNYDLQNLYNNFRQSDYASYDFNATNGFEFKKVDDIFHELYKYFVLFAVIAIVSFITTFIYNAFLDVSALRQSTKIRSLVFKSLMKQDIPWHEKANPGELSSRIISDTLLIEDGIGSKIGMLYQNLTTFVFCMIIAFISGWKLSLYMSGTFILVTIVVIIMSTVLANITKKAQDSYATAGGIAQETFSQARTVVSFGNEQKESDRYTQKLMPTLKLGMKKSHILGISMGLIFGVAYFSYSIAFIKGGQFVNKGELIAGDVLKILMSVMFGASSFGMCGTSFTAISAATGAAAILFHIIQREPKINKESGECPSQPLKGHIEFRDVHFTYPSRPDTEILKGINFKCLPGQTIALVGASGSGKSTIVQLLERYYEKSDGQILIDGKEIEGYNIPWLRSQIGLVSQEPILFDATIAENIAITCPGATPEQIETAAKLANAHEFISKLSHGYQTKTGEKGLQLSGGQKQRICIARALISNPNILLLDEATSALDNQSEKIIQKALDSVSVGRTTIVIAHRLTTVRNAHCIIVMNKGTIVECGTHEELMAKGNTYYHLVKNQELKAENTKDLTNEMTEEINDDSIKYSDANDNFENIASSNSELIVKQKGTGSEAQSTSINESKNIDWRRPYLDYNKPVWFKNIIGIIGSLFNGCMQPVCAYIYASAINAFNKQGNDLLDSTKFWGLMFMVLALANFIAAYFKNYGFSSAGEYLLYIFRKEMYDSMIKQDISFFDTGDKLFADSNNNSSTNVNSNDSSNNTSVGTLTAKLSTETTLAQGLNLNFGTILETITGVIVCFVIAFCHGWKLSLILLAFTPFLFIGVYIQMKEMASKNDEKRRIFENSTKIAVEAILGVKTVNALNLEDRFSTLYDNNLVEPQKRIEHKHYTSGLGIGFGNAMSFISYGVGFYFGFVFLKNGELDFESMFRVVMAIIFTSNTIGQASTAGPDFVKAVDAFKRILRMISRQPKIDASDPKGIQKESFNGKVSFNQLRFSYPSRPDITVLRMGSENIEIQKGKTLALVGGSGCGKSTLIGLLLRWYDAQCGDIKIDGEKNTNYNIKWLRQQIGIVSQEPCLFNISIKDNIRYGKDDASDEEIQEAAKKANIHNFIMSLPEGYDTLVGGEGTSQMSGGQKQRIAIARAIIRSPKILLLDEATSALDAESELVVQNALEEASQGRTIITIAHRLSTIKNADIIVVMREGRIVEKGNHQELLKKKGDYYEMILAGDNGV
ncbi:multidrug resistance protein 1 [Piromyces finnis]|uniref:Multidrug resistance protein 1 n=1 Tax=Piromyces finnis TaxID=1754191 RepID=A0A1Y1V5H0_9FUNG|nr:multidrug resistance protein 1 [Piromyces finnis]|eukprot:ORX47670.1 multidrug resistance protein 1 [Piromyces finnis]